MGTQEGEWIRMVWAQAWWVICVGVHFGSGWDGWIEVVVLVELVLRREVVFGGWDW